MTNTGMPVVTCDAEEGCDAWEVDLYAMGAATLNGVRVTDTPFGWASAPGGWHYCPEHIAEASQPIGPGGQPAPVGQQVTSEGDAR